MLLGVLFTANAAGQTNELQLSRDLIDALERENAALRERLDTEKQKAVLLAELSETRRAEAEALRAAMAAKTDALRAKDETIAAQERLIGELRGRKASLWKRIGDVAIGAVIGAVLR